MLDTGIDVREIVNLVFAKPVYSYTKFWQMLGRGTRLLEASKIKPWCTEKDVFLVLDCWDNFEYFKLQPKGKELKPQLPLPVRLVGIRLEKIEKALAIGQLEITVKEVAKLRRQIQELPASSVTIIEAATALDHIADDNYWTHLTPQKIEFLRNQIKPLFRTVSQVDFKAMRFEKDVLEISLALLSEENAKFETLKEGLVEQIGELPLSVHIVAKQAALIQSAQQNHYWSACSDATLNELAEELAPLMKFREQQNPGQGPAKLDLTDVLHNKEMVDFGPRHEAVGVSKYRDMVEALVLELTHSNPILQKIKSGANISATEAEELANQLKKAHPHITANLLRIVYRNRKAHFIQFIRHILGIEFLASFPQTVAKTFDQFIAAHTDLNSRQLEFLRLLKDFIIEREQVEKRDLIQAPFTIIHPQGIRGVFRPAEIDEILQLTEQLAA
jgi:type I restriction enzyme R subunit